MPSTNNKVKFGLKNCHYAKATLVPDTNAVTFGTPVAIPRAVNLSLDPEGDIEPFYADDMVYYTTVANNGYSGDLEITATPLLLLRCVQLGIHISELDLLTIGTVLDMYTELQRDDEPHDQLASQDDMDRF